MRRLVGRWFIPALAALLALTVDPVPAQEFRPSDSSIDPEIFRIDEKERLGVKLAAEYSFIDHEGKEFSMMDLRGEPLIVVLSYFSCDGFCPAFNADTKKLLEKVLARGRVTLDEDFRLLTVSFDRHDDPMSTKRFREMLKLPENLEKGWRMATFKNSDDIKKFTSELGFKFFWSAADKQFFHPNTYFFISSQGRLVRILHDSIAGEKDMELGILDARFNRMRPSEILNMAVSLCYSYNYKDGKYGLNYPMFFAFGSLFTGISAFLYAARYLRKRRFKT